MTTIRPAVVAMALVLGACGGGTDDPDQPSDETVAVTAADGPTPEADAPGGGDFDCNDALGSMLVLQQDYSYSVRRGTAPEPVDYGDLADQLEAVAASAPDDIAATMDDYAGQIAPYWRELAAIGFDPSDPGSADPEAYAAATQQLDGQAVDEAWADLEAWLTGPCEDG